MASDPMKSAEVGNRMSRVSTRVMVMDMNLLSLAAFK